VAPSLVNVLVLLMLNLVLPSAVFDRHQIRISLCITVD